jgi:hypothetical protein
MGIPKLNISLSIVGAFSSYTLAGEPEKIIPAGFLFIISEIGALHGIISEYTLNSLILLAIS